LRRFEKCLVPVSLERAATADRGYDEPQTLSYAISSIRPVGPDGGQFNAQAQSTIADVAFGRPSTLSEANYFQVLFNLVHSNVGFAPLEDLGHAATLLVEVVHLTLTLAPATWRNGSPRTH
jgi:hypothetical protein